MHIPSEILHGAVCPVSAVLAAAGIAGSFYALSRKKEPAPEPGKFALVSASLFCVQMLNYPIWDGISGHLIGGVFAASLLGVPAAVLATALVLLLQTLLFADGGISMLGANVLNMAVLGAGAGGLLLVYFRRKNADRITAVVLASAASVVLAVLALSAELMASGKGSLSIIISLISIHLVLAVLEGGASGLLLKVIPASENSSESRKIYFALSVLIGAGLLVSPLTSEFPDAFEWTMLKSNLLPDAPNFVNAPFMDYMAFGSQFLAGLIGVVVTAGSAFVLANFFPKKVYAE